MYDVSADEDFILDYLPGDRRVVFASGLTGHGFKFGLVLGELLSSLLRETEPVVAMERFQLARFARQWREQESSVA
jgi:glycine/D-amino acid oxidase-like deaminating enzyme